MVIETKGNLFDARDWSVILHQVNCMGIAGAGLAKQMDSAFPGWKASYAEHCHAFRPEELIGTFRSFKAGEKKIVCDAFGQIDISKARRMTDYKAWQKIFPTLERQIRKMNSEKGIAWSLHIPYRLGCGLGGGDWSEMRRMIEFYFGDSPVQAVIHRLPGQA